MPTSTSAAKSFSLSDLNMQKKCEKGVPFEPVDSAGKELGIKLTVLGAHAPQVQEWVNKELNRQRLVSEVSKRKGRRPSFVNIEEDIQFGIEMVSVRITGWEGITEPWSPENSLLLCTTNPDICSQVREFSEELANFTKG